MFNKSNYKPFRLILGHDYEVGFSLNSLTVVRLVKTTPKGFKFLNMKTNTCLRQIIMYPSKEPNHIDKGETWFWLPDTFQIREVPRVDNKMEYILCAAIWYKDLVLKQVFDSNVLPVNCDRGLVFCGHRHPQCMYTMCSITGLRSVEPEVGEYVQGFLTSTNRFVDRYEGGEIAFKAGQSREFLRTLYSEDIY
jgi:hypothetical protein